MVSEIETINKQLFECKSGKYIKWMNSSIFVLLSFSYKLGVI